MCFSASSSFAVSAVLIPAGVYCVQKARQVAPNWLPFAVFPLMFALQQAFEGGLWLGISAGDEQIISACSRGFLFFSHFFWLAWVPFAAYWLEVTVWRKKLLLGLTIIGALFGLSIFLPSFLIQNHLSVEVIQGSIEYKTKLIYDGIVNRTVLRIFYAIIVVSALLTSSDRVIQLFGGLILASVLVTYAFFGYAFISIWCFFAAILSLYICAVLRRKSAQSLTQPLASKT